MPISTWTVVGPSDLQISQLFQSLEAFSKNKASYLLSALSEARDFSEIELVDLLDDQANIINNIQLSCNNFSVQYYRNKVRTQDNNLNPHPIYSSISLSVPDYGGAAKPDQREVIECHIKIAKYVKQENIDAGVLSDSKDIQPDPHMALVSQIQASSAEQITRTNKYFADLVEKFDTRSEEIDKRYEQRKKELEGEFAAKYERLEADRDALEKLKKELDDRNNTHARRAIRGELLTTIQGRQERFAISKDTKNLRLPIHMMFIFLIFSTFAGALWTLYVWGTSPAEGSSIMMITSGVKTVIFSASFLTTAGLYVSWMNRWFDKHSEAQFQTKQFEIDINRATWAVEAALEWRGVQGEAMPDALLVGITKHLFEATTPENSEYSPLEALATSILGSASNLALDLNGNKVNLDRKSLKEMKSK